MSYIQVLDNECNLFWMAFRYYKGVFRCGSYSDITQQVSFDFNRYLDITRAYFDVGYIQILRSECHLIWIII